MTRNPLKEDGHTKELSPETCEIASILGQFPGRRRVSDFFFNGLLERVQRRYPFPSPVVRSLIISEHACQRPCQFRLLDPVEVLSRRKGIRCARVRDQFEVDGEMAEQREQVH